MHNNYTFFIVIWWKCFNQFKINLSYFCPLCLSEWKKLNLNRPAIMALYIFQNFFLSSFQTWHYDLYSIFEIIFMWVKILVLPGQSACCLVIDQTKLSLNSVISSPGLCRKKTIYSLILKTVSSSNSFRK